MNYTLAWWRLFTSCPRCRAKAGDPCRRPRGVKPDAFVPYCEARKLAAKKRQQNGLATERA